MDTLTQLTLVATAFFLVFLNGFFVSAEFSIVKVRQTRLQELNQQGHRRAKTALKMIRNMDEYLSATQLGITLASLGLGWIGEPAFAGIFEQLLETIGISSVALSHTLSVGTAFLLITFLHIVLGELAPKSLAIQKPEQTVLLAGYPMNLFFRISYPFNWALNGTAAGFLRLIGFQPSSESALAHSEEELRILLSESHKSGVIDPGKQKMLERVFEFTERSVRQVMLPSVDVIFLDIRKDLEANLKLARKQRHTRYPLCDGSLDRVIGIVHVKDLFWNYKLLGSDFDLSSVIRPVHFVPESKGVEALLSDFRKSRIHLAIVVDEFGSTVGIVTMEDVLEELVGEIQDEFDTDTPPRMVRETTPGTFHVQGRALISEVEARLGIQLNDDENDTIAGHILMKLGRTAKIGDQVQLFEGISARVVGMRGFQITDVVMKRRG